MIEPRWHGYVGWIFTGSKGEYCGSVGVAYPANDEAHAYQYALDYLRDFDPKLYWPLTRTFVIEVRYF